MRASLISILFILTGCSGARVIGDTAIIAVDRYCRLHSSEKSALGHIVNEQIYPHHILISCGK